MKPDYKNWVPRGLLFLLGGMAIICLALCIVFGMAGVATAHRARRSLWRSVFAVCRPDGHICKYVLRLFVSRQKAGFKTGDRRHCAIRCIVGRRKGVGCRMRQRGAYHRLCKAQSARADGRHRPLGQRIRLVQSSALRTQCRGGRSAKRIFCAGKRRKTWLYGRNLRRRDEQLRLSQH